MTLAATAEFDDRLRKLTDEEAGHRISAWSQAIMQTNLTLDDLLQGVLRAYSRERRPENPIGSIIHEAKQHRNSKPRPKEIQQPDIHIGITGYAIEAAYSVDMVLTIECECGAKVGEFCTHNGELRKIPHNSRLAAAYRLHNPEGKKQHEQRQKHLQQHRRTYTPKFKTRKVK